MKQLITFFLIAISVGCGKKDSTAPQAAEAAASEVESSPTEQASAPTGAVQDNQPAPIATARARPTYKRDSAGVNEPPAQAVQVAALEGAVHAAMTMELHKYIRKTGRMPKDFSEFAGGAMDSVPFAPEGMEYVIDYANKQVKVVKIKKTK